jgi:hypothetical protein
VTIAYLASMIFDIYILFKTSITDPGIIPRRTFIMEEEKQMVL